MTCDFSGAILPEQIFKKYIYGCDLRVILPEW